MESARRLVHRHGRAAHQYSHGRSEVCRREILPPVVINCSSSLEPTIVSRSSKLVCLADMDAQMPRPVTFGPIRISAHWRVDKRLPKVCFLAAPLPFTASLKEVTILCFIPRQQA